MYRIVCSLVKLYYPPQLSGQISTLRQDGLDARISGVMKIIQTLRKVEEKTRRNGENDPDRDAYDVNLPRDESGDGAAADTANPSPQLNPTLQQEWGEWENRYMVHNPQIELTNQTRQILLKYYLSSQARRGLMYHISAAAVKFIRELAHEHDKKRGWSRRKSTRTGSSRPNNFSMSSSYNNNSKDSAANSVNRLLDDLVNPKGSFWAKNESETESAENLSHSMDLNSDNVTHGLPEEYDLNSGHLVLLIKPQIALWSNVDDKSKLVLTAFRAQVKVFAVVEKELIDDPVNAIVVHQTFATLDGLQAFYPKEETSPTQINRGHTKFVPLETLVDLRVDPWGFDRVVPRTNAALRYDKFNKLRLGSKTGFESKPASAGGPLTAGGGNYFETGTDRICFECDRFSVSANPDHFGAVYNVVTDLLLYSDPNEKAHNSKLDAIVFTRDFSNLNETSRIVMRLQTQLREEARIIGEYTVHFDELDEFGIQEMVQARYKMMKLSEQLGMTVQAITRAQDFHGGQKISGSDRAGIELEARASSLEWHMLDQSDTPFAKFSIRGVEFHWMSKQNSSVSNRLLIKDLKALNSSPKPHFFSEIISKHDADPNHQMSKVDMFAAVLWNTLPAVGGIPIIEQFSTLR